MSHLGKQLSILKPQVDHFDQARLHTLQHDASVSQRLGKVTLTPAWKRGRKNSSFVDSKPYFSTDCKLSRINPTSAQEPPHRDVEQEQYAVANRLPFSQTISPLSLLAAGQSDPFDALAITVTPEINEIISFGRDVFLPTLYDTKGAKQSFIVNRNFQDSLSQLSSKGPAFGLLSYIAAAASLVAGGPAWAQRAIKYEVECTSVLREKLANAPISQYPELITQILTLFGCTIFTGRMAEAKTHAIILQKLFDVCVKHGPVDIARLCFALYHNRNLSAMFLIRSSFDVDQWLPKLISPIWQRLGSPFAHLSEVPQQKLDRAINRADSSFIRLIDELRNHYHTVVLTRERWSQDTTPSNLLMYHVSHSVVYESRLINYYLDLTEAPVLPQHELWPQAYICLATLYMAHSLLYSGLVRLSDTSAMLKEHLKNAIFNAEQAATIQSRNRHTNALLWALFIGATAERVGNGASNDGSRWFNIRFREHILSMGITRWSDIRKVILGFPCASELLEQDVSWVESLLKHSYDVDGTIRFTSSAFRMYNNQTGGFD